MALSPTTDLVTVSDVQNALQNDDTVTVDTITFAVEATKAHVLRYHSVASVTAGDPPVVAWPYDYKLGAVKLAAGLVRSGFSTAVSTDPNDPLAQSALNRLTDIEIEQLLQIGRWAIPKVG